MWLCCFSKKTMGRRAFSLSLWLLCSAVIVCADDDDSDCKVKDIKGIAFNIYKETFQATQGHLIKNITLVERSSFYTCKRDESYGCNSTHWWVSKGCGGHFRLTECPEFNSVFSMQ